MKQRVDLREISLGVELEFVKQTRQRVARAVQSVVGGIIRHIGTPACYDPWQVLDERGRVWKIVSDASLCDVPSRLRAEVVSPILTYADIPQLQEVVRAVRTQAHARVTSRCGLHVHISAEGFGGRALGNLAKIVYKQEELLIRALGISQSRMAQYCKPSCPEFIRAIERERPRTREHFNRLWFGYQNMNPNRHDSSRYRMLNFTPVWTQNSFEFRCFGSTNHAGRVKAYLQLCLALAAKALNARAASAKKRVANGRSDKYDFRICLIHLNLIGDEFKTCRKHLLANLAGSAAWKYGKPTPKNITPVQEGAKECA